MELIGVIIPSRIKDPRTFDFNNFPIINNNAFHPTIGFCSFLEKVI